MSPLRTCDSGVSSDTEARTVDLNGSHCMQFGDSYLPTGRLRSRSARIVKVLVAGILVQREERGGGGASGAQPAPDRHAAGCRSGHGVQGAQVGLRQNPPLEEGT